MKPSPRDFSLANPWRTWYNQVNRTRHASFKEEVGSFFKEVKMRKNHQPPLTIAEQIQHLKALGLTVLDEHAARRILKRVSYYRLIKGYGRTLKWEGRFIAGASLEDIVDLYQFDQALRRLILTLLEPLELALRAAITQHFSLRYGNFGHLHPENAGRGQKQAHFAQAVKELKAQAKRSQRAKIVEHFKQHYQGGQVPFYALVEVASFGTLVQLFKQLASGDKRQVAESFNVEVAYLESWLDNFSHLRNICAHYGRLYGRYLEKPTRLYARFRQAGVKNNTLMASLLNLRQVTPPDLYQVFYDRLVALISAHPVVDLKQLGFPKEGWDLLLPEGYI